MMMKKSLITAMMILLCFSKISFGEATVEEVKKMGIEEIIGLLNHPDWQERDKAIVYGLSKFRKIDDRGFPQEFNEFEGKEQISIALIRLLERENLRREEWWKKWHEEYERIGKEPPLGWYPEGWEKPGEGRGEYYIDLVAIVIKLKDERAISAIVGAVECGAPSMAVIEFGELAIPYLLERLEKTKSYATSDIIRTLGEIAKRAESTPPVVKGTATTKAPLKSPAVSQVDLMKDAFIKNLNNPNEFTRMEAIKSLGILEDTSVIPLLKQIAKNDPRAWNTVSGDPSKFIYPVREEAERVIKLLEKKREEKEQKK